MFNQIYLDALVESKLSKIWRESLNKKICEKRANLELIETLNEWSNAKSNYLAECKY